MRDLLLRLAVQTATIGVGPEHPDGNAVLDRFFARVAAMKAPRVLELGTARVDAAIATRRDAWVPHAAEYLGSDLRPGPDVDLVADVHRLSSVAGEERFDVVISCSTFEHYKYPHLAAHEILKVLKVGGVLFVHTHQSFPLHAHPHDYFRFSREALASCFGTKMGFCVIATDYEYPARIVGRHDPRAALSPAFMYVRMVGEKLAKTPREFVYELED